MAEELAEHWMVLPADLEVLGNRTGATRLGYALLPLRRPEGRRSPPPPTLTRPINWDLIRRQYDPLVKFASALRLGTAETEAILHRFTRTNVQHCTYLVVLIKTLLYTSVRVSELVNIRLADGYRGKRLERRADACRASVARQRCLSGAGAVKAEHESNAS